MWARFRTVKVHHKPFLLRCLLSINVHEDLNDISLWLALTLLLFSLSLPFSFPSHCADYLHFSTKLDIAGVLCWCFDNDDYRLNYNRAESFAELFYHGCSVSLIKYQIYTTESFVVLVMMAFLLSSLSKLLLNNTLSSNECLSISWNASWIYS